MRPWKHRRLLVPVAIVCASAGLLAALALLDDEADSGTSTGAGANNRDDLPDLTMSPPSDLRVEARAGGGYDLRFTSVMNNAGVADLVLAGERDGPDNMWTMAQEVSGDAGTSARSTGALLVWGGDGHDHWHIVAAARYALEGAHGTSRRDDKVGFCIFDGTVAAPDSAGEPPTYVEPGCGDQDSEIVEMGLSVGWGDPYRSTLPGQLIDITGLPAGRYRLVATVDPEGLFEESDTDNNEAWTDFDLSWDGSGSPSIEVPLRP